MGLLIFSISRFCWLVLAACDVSWSFAVLVLRILIMQSSVTNDCGCWTMFRKQLSRWRTTCFKSTWPRSPSSDLKSRRRCRRRTWNIGQKLATRCTTSSEVTASLPSCLFDVAWISCCSCTVAHAGCEEHCALDSFVDLSAVLLVMVALCNRADHYIFILFLLSFFFLLLLFFFLA